MSPSKSALIVIDVQESFRHRPYWSETELPSFIANLQSLIDRSRSAGVPVLQIFHVDEDDGPQGAFSRASGHVRTLPELRIEPDAVFTKNVHSALFGRTADGTTLESWLAARDIGRLVITGIRTEQCCETTARHASDLGFEVCYVTAATLTFPMTSAAGRVFSAADIRERTELVLAGRFATIASAEAAFA